MPIIRKTSITLPKDNAKVRFRFGPTSPWIHGIYIASENMFFVNNQNFFYTHEVEYWIYNTPKPVLDIKNCSSCAIPDACKKHGCNRGHSQKFEPCKECDLPNACNELGCAVALGIRQETWYKEV